MTFKTFLNYAVIGAFGIIVSIVSWSVVTSNATSANVKVIGKELSYVKVSVDEHTKLDNARAETIDRRVTVNEANSKHTIALLQELRQDVKSIMYTIGAPSIGAGR